MSALDFSCSEVLRLSSEVSPNVVGAKFSDNNMEDMKRCLDLGMNMLTGSDEYIARAYALGAEGTIGLSQNFLGQLEAEIEKKVKAGLM